MKKDKYTRQELSDIVNDLLTRSLAVSTDRPVSYKGRYDRQELSEICNYLLDRSGLNTSVAEFDNDLQTEHAKWPTSDDLEGSWDPEA